MNIKIIANCFLPILLISGVLIVLNSDDGFLMNFFGVFIIFLSVVFQFLLIKEFKLKENNSKIIILIIFIIICRVLEYKLKENFYDYISYIYSIGLLLIILLPNLDRFKFWGIEAINQQKDETGNIIGKTYDEESKN
ncbi:hypothetical protein KAS41_02670 [Candidatus Parcubacteria bacterium]|nr:hypothetical protein [Candidatus Parcubacteria bacterium]